MTPDDRVLTVRDVRQMVSYVRTAFDFDDKTADWALDEITNLLNAWDHLHYRDENGKEMFA